ncbi:MAG: hypothetical protein ACTSUE_19840 [Promethearchaeota archaeon]
MKKSAMALFSEKTSSSSKQKKGVEGGGIFGNIKTKPRKRFNPEDPLPDSLTNSKPNSNSNKRRGVRATKKVRFDEQSKTSAPAPTLPISDSDRKNENALLIVAASNYYLAAVTAKVGQKNDLSKEAMLKHDTIIAGLTLT